MPPKNKLRGSNILKVVSIIMIIWGAISVASGIITPNSGSMLVSFYGVDEVAIKYFQVTGAITIMTGAVLLVCGIFGVRLNNKAERINLLILLGIINIIVTAFSTIYSVIMAPVGMRIVEQVMDVVRGMGSAFVDNINVGGMMQNIPLTAAGFVLPVLFIVGAFMNKLPPKPPRSIQQTQPEGTQNK